MGFYIAQSGFKLCVLLRVALNSHCYFKSSYTGQTSSRARTAWECDTFNPRPQMVRDGKCEPSRYLRSLLFNIRRASCLTCIEILGNLSIWWWICACIIRNISLNILRAHTHTHSAASTELVPRLGRAPPPPRTAVLCRYSRYSITHSFCVDRCWISHWTELGCVFILLNKDNPTS